MHLPKLVALRYFYFMKGNCRIWTKIISGSLFECRKYSSDCRGSNALFDCHCKCKNQEKNVKMLHLQKSRLGYHSPDIKENIKYAVEMVGKE